MKPPPVGILVVVALFASASLLVSQGGDPEPWNGRSSLREVKAAVREYFEADAARRAEIRSFLDGLGNLRPQDAKSWTRRIVKEIRRHGPKLERKSGRVFTHAGLSSPVYTAGRPKQRGALLVGLHGGGEGSGDGKNALQKWSAVGGKAWVIAPTAPELRNSAWNHADIEAWVLALIEAAVRTYGIDTNRIYLAGHSMGGFGTWSIGSRHADRFAALGAGAGGLFMIRGGAEPRIAPGLVPNLLNTPIRFYHSTDDARVSAKSDQCANRELERLKAAGYSYRWVYEEFTDVGHGLPPKGLKPTLDWMLQFRRNPHPNHVVWEPSRPSKRRFFWLGAQRDVRIEGKIEGDLVTLKTEQPIDAVTVYLCRHLVDVKAPVRISLNGEEVFSGKVAPRLSVLLDTAATGRDPAQLYDRAITVP